MKKTGTKANNHNHQAHLTEPDDNQTDAEEDLTFDKNSSARRCLVTRETLPKEALIRFVVAPDNSVVPDLEEKLGGRGLWVSCSRKMVEDAVKKNLFSKAAKTKTKVDLTLPERLESLILHRCINFLGLSRKAGNVIYGFEKVSAALKKGEIALLFAARDGAEDGKRKIKNLAGSLPIMAELTSAELSGALGRENVIHVAVKGGKLADKLKAECKKLEAYRSSPMGAEQTADGINAVTRS